MKSIKLVFVIFLITLASSAQVIKKDTIEAEKPLDRKDTIAQTIYELEEVYVSNRYDPRSAEERKRFLILQRRVLKTYPYAKIAADRLTALNNGMNSLTSDRDKKKYFKLVENYLTNEFEEQLKKMSRRDGQILVKLIDRQTGSSTYELIRDLKSGWKAFWSNNTARLFDINLKTKFDPSNVWEDFRIEGILYHAFADGRLPRQPAKNNIQYNELGRIWQEKIKAMKQQEE